MVDIPRSKSWWSELNYLRGIDVGGAGEQMKLRSSTDVREVRLDQRLRLKAIVYKMRVTGSSEHENWLLYGDIKCRID